MRPRRGAGVLDDAGVWMKTQYGKMPEPLQKALPILGAVTAASLAAYLGHKHGSKYFRTPEALELGWVDVPAPRQPGRFRIVRKEAGLSGRKKLY